MCWWFKLGSPIFPRWWDRSSLITWKNRFFPFFAKCDFLDFFPSTLCVAKEKSPNGIWIKWCHVNIMCTKHPNSCLLTPFVCPDWRTNQIYRGSKIDPFLLIFQLLYFKTPRSSEVTSYAIVKATSRHCAFKSTRAQPLRFVQKASNKEREKLAYA